jgi:hypothetical protein
MKDEYGRIIDDESMTESEYSFEDYEIDDFDIDIDE